MSRLSSQRSRHNSETADSTVTYSSTATEMGGSGALVDPPPPPPHTSSRPCKLAPQHSQTLETCRPTHCVTGDATPASESVCVCFYPCLAEVGRLGPAACLRLAATRLAPLLEVPSIRVVPCLVAVHAFELLRALPVLHTRKARGPPSAQ